MYMHFITPGIASAQTVREEFEKYLKQNFNQWGVFNHVCWESLKSVNHVVIFINMVKQPSSEVNKPTFMIGFLTSWLQFCMSLTCM